MFGVGREKGGGRERRGRTCTAHTHTDRHRERDREGDRQGERFCEGQRDQTLAKDVHCEVEIMYEERLLFCKPKQTVSRSRNRWPRGWGL